MSTYYEKRVVFVDAVAAVADYYSSIVDLRSYDTGIVKLEWSNYNGTTGKARLQISDENSSTNSKWGNWGGSDGQYDVATTSGTLVFALNTIGPYYMRFNFEMGDGTTVTLTVSHILGR